MQNKDTQSQTEKQELVKHFINSFRMHEEEFPDIDDLVIARITKIGDMGAEVQLVEYQSLEGFLSAKHYTRKGRIKSVRKIIQEGKEYPLQVIGLDKDKKYVDLSKKLVTNADAKKCQACFKKTKKVHSILASCAVMHNTTIEDLYKLFGWKLYKDYGHPYDAFQLVCNEEPVLDGYDIPKDILSDLLKLVKKNFSVKPIRFAKSINLMSLDPNGIEVIRNCLIETGKQHPNVKIVSSGAPSYEVSFTCKNEKEANEIYNQVLKTCGDYCQKFSKTWVK